VWLCVRPEELRAVRHNGSRPDLNQVPAKLVRVSDRPRSVWLEFEGDISVEMPLREFEHQRDNKDWLVEFPPDALKVL
jgi:hypothetical protein